MVYGEGVSGELSTRRTSADPEGDIMRSGEAPRPSYDLGEASLFREGPVVHTRQEEEEEVSDYRDEYAGAMRVNAKLYFGGRRGLDLVTRAQVCNWMMSMLRRHVGARGDTLRPDVFPLAVLSLDIYFNDVDPASLNMDLHAQYAVAACLYALSARQPENVELYNGSVLSRFYQEDVVLNFNMTLGLRFRDGRMLDTPVNHMAGMFGFPQSEVGSPAFVSAARLAIVLAHMSMLLPSQMGFDMANTYTNPCDLVARMAVRVAYNMERTFFLEDDLKSAFDNRFNLTGVRELMSEFYPDVEATQLAACQKTCTTSLRVSPPDEVLLVPPDTPPVQMSTYDTSFNLIPRVLQEEEEKEVPPPVGQEDGATGALTAAQVAWDTAAAYGMGASATFKGRWYTVKGRALLADYMVSRSSVGSGESVGIHLNLVDRYMAVNPDYRDPNTYADELYLTEIASRVTVSLSYEMGTVSTATPDQIRAFAAGDVAKATFRSSPEVFTERLVSRVEALAQLAGDRFDPPTVPRLVYLMIDPMYTTWLGDLGEEEMQRRINRAQNLSTLCLIFPSLLMADGVQVALAVLRMAGLTVGTYEPDPDATALLGAALCSMKISSFCGTLEAFQRGIVQPLRAEAAQLHFATCYVDGFNMPKEDAALVL